DGQRGRRPAGGAVRGLPEGRPGARPRDQRPAPSAPSRVLRAAVRRHAQPHEGGTRAARAHAPRPRAAAAHAGDRRRARGDPARPRPVAAASGLTVPPRRRPRPGGRGGSMPMRWQDQAWSQGLWYQGKVTRRAVLGLGAAAAGALGAVLLEPPPWRAAFGQATPYRIGSLQPLTGAAAAGGRMALIGTELAVRRINRAGGINGRPVELIVEDYQSAPDAGRRKAEKLATEDRVDAHAGGFLSNVCLACMPVWEEHQIVNMIGVGLDTTITTTRCSRYTFRPFDYAPAQALAFAPALVRLARRWHLVYADYAWGQSTRDAYAGEIRKLGGEVVGATGIPLGTADMTPFLSQIGGSFEGLFGISFGKDGVTLGIQAYDL